MHSAAQRAAETQQAHEEHGRVQQVQHRLVDRTHFVVGRGRDADVAGRQAQVELVARERLAGGLGFGRLLGQLLAQVDVDAGERVVFVAEFLHGGDDAVDRRRAVIGQEHHDRHRAAVGVQQA